MDSKQNCMNERSITIPIKQKNNSQLNSPTCSTMKKGEYSLNHCFFDPTTNSPPNDFINKLQQRMSVYNKPSVLFINDDNCDSE